MQRKPQSPLDKDFIEIMEILEVLLENASLSAVAEG